MVHLAHSTPPSVMADALQMYDNDIHHAFAECTAFGYAWQQAQLSLSRCGLGFCSPSQHTAATYISSMSASGQCSVSCSTCSLSELLPCIHFTCCDHCGEIVSSPCHQHALSSKIEKHQRSPLAVKLFPKSL